MLRSALVAAIDALPQTPFEGSAFRHLPPRFSPLSGQGARMLGGRWNPPESFSVLYLGLDRQTVVDEFRRHIAKQARELEDLLPRLFVEYAVKFEDLLDLRSAHASATLALPEAALTADEPLACRAIGAAAHQLGREGIIAPSAAGAGTTLSVFIDSLHANSSVVPIEREEWVEMP